MESDEGAYRSYQSVSALLPRSVYGEGLGGWVNVQEKGRSFFFEPNGNGAQRIKPGVR